MKSHESVLKNIRFVRYGDLVMINESSLGKLGLDLSSLSNDGVFEDLKRRFRCSRVAVKSHINDDDFRSPNVILLGPDSEKDPWVVQVDNGIKYCFNIQKSMFSRGNINEKLRLSKLDCSNEIVLDLFAGIGYFAMVFAVHCNAKRVYCCEWNPVAVEALRRNAVLNKVDHKIVICEGDNRLMAPVGVATRVNMGLIPTSLGSLEVACKALDVHHTSSPLYLHVHENLTYDLNPSPISNSKSKKDQVEVARKEWADGIVEQVYQTMSRLHSDVRWHIEAQQVVCIKPYAPHIDHMVVDVCCTRL